MVETNLNKKPLISIIINCRNGEKYLKKSVSSVLNQTYNNWEIIFFDNNSSDKSHKIIKSFKEKRIRYIKSKKFIKLYKARNLAIKKAKGEYISFLDVDDWWLKNKLKDQVKYLNENKNVDILYSNIFLFYEKKRKKEIYCKTKLHSGNITQNLLDDFKMSILSTMIRKNIFKNMKFNDTYDIIGDFDFFIRISILKKIFAIQKPLACYRIHGSNLSIKKTDINIIELEKWIKDSIKIKRYKNFNFDKMFELLNILKIKNFIIKNKKFEAFKMILERPYFFSKFKFIIFFIMPKKLFTRYLNWF